MAADVDAKWEESIPLSVEQWVDGVCDRFEAAWRDGQCPPVEDFLGSRNGLERSAVLFELVTLEIAYRRRRAEHLGPEEYLARFPDDAKLIEPILASFVSDESTNGPDAAGTRRSIPVTCPAGHAFRVDAKYTGRAGKCAYCDERVEVVAEPPEAAVDTSATSQGETIAWQPDDETTPPASKQSEQQAESQQIGRFRIVEELGKGAFGSVHRAYDPQLEREVALKVPSKGVFETEEELERFLREARAAATLHHQNICTVYETGNDGERHYIAMAYISGTTLDSVIRGETSIDEREAVAMVRTLALALDEAHRAGIIHRDLKPSNIMIDERGEPVIMDFGLARRVKSDEAQLTHEGQILGTPAYMPPEQARGEIEKIGPASDIFSLGTILYELLCGQRPFQGSMFELISQVLRDDPEPPSTHRPDLDARLDAICLRTMAKAAEDRYGSMRELADALDEYLQSPDSEAAGAEAVCDRPSSDSGRLGAIERPLASVPPVRRRSNWQWIAAAVALIGLALGVTIYIPLSRGTLEIQVLDDDVKVIVSRRGDVVRIIDTKTNTQVRLGAGQYELKLSDAKSGLRVVPDKFALKRGGRVVARIEFTELKQASNTGWAHEGQSQGNTNFLSHPSRPLKGNLKLRLLWSQPKVGSTRTADLDGDSDIEIVGLRRVGQGRFLVVLDGDGNELWRRDPVDDADLASPHGTSRYDMGDVDCDGSFEIVINVNCDKGYTSNQPNHILIYDGDGTLIRGFPVLHGAWAYPVAADVTGDGRPEIVAGVADYTGQHGAYVYKINGELMGRTLTGAALDSGVVADIDGDGINEALFGHFASHNHQKERNSVNDLNSHVVVIEGDGSLKWVRRIGTNIVSVVVSDLSGDGNAEILALQRQSPTYPGNNEVHLLDAATGKTLDKFVGSPEEWLGWVVADIQGDGTQELVLASPVDGRLRVLSSDLDLLAEKEWKAGTNVFAGNDLDGDGAVELVVGVDTVLHVIDSALEARWSLDLGSRIHDAIVSDVDSDGINEILAETSAGISVLTLSDNSADGTVRSVPE